MKERPILFSAPMVRAILEGRKTQTRRIVKPAPGYQSEWATVKTLSECPTNYLCEVQGRLGAQFQHPLAGKKQMGVDIPKDSPYGWFACPYGKPGDRLWVRETWNFFDPEEIPKERHGSVAPFVGGQAGREIPWVAAYAADGELEHKDLGRSVWKPSIHMPRWASRIDLLLRDVRIGRLQGISPEDVVAEGIIKLPASGHFVITPGAQYFGQAFATARGAFCNLWKSINGEDSWNMNPWVWALDLEVLKK